MFCPRCGQQQTIENTRFCSRCGFLLIGVTQLLNSGGLIPGLESSTNQISARRRGVRQGVALLLVGLVLTPIMAVLLGHSPLRFLIPLTAIVGFWGGLLRILYAAIFEKGELVNNPPVESFTPIQKSVAPYYLKNRPTNTPKIAQSPAPSFVPARLTGELTQPSSVTEATTKLLDNTPQQ